MSGVSRELFNKVVAIICAVVFVIGVGSLLAYTLHSQAKDEEMLEEIKKASMELELQKNQYTRELNNLESEMLASLPCGSTLTLVTLSVDDDLYTLLYPLMNATHELCDPETEVALVGTMCLTPTKLPGDEGCITMEQYEELLAAGWSTAIYVSSGYAKTLDGYLSGLEATFEGRGIEMPKVAYFAKQSYSPNYDGILVAHGIEGIFHHEENGYDLICQDSDSAIWRVGSIDWNTKNVAPNMLTSILNIPGNTSFTFSFTETEPNSYFTGDPMANAAADRMFDKMRESVVIDDLVVDSALAGKEAFVTYTNEYNTAAPLLEPQKAELRRLIEEINVKLMDIYAGKLPEED